MDADLPDLKKLDREGLLALLLAERRRRSAPIAAARFASWGKTSHILGVMLQYMTEPDVKLLPLTVKLNAWPAVALFGMRAVMTGALLMELDFLV